MEKFIQSAVKDLELEGVVLNEKQLALIEDYACGKIDKDTFVKEAVKLS